MGRGKKGGRKEGRKGGREGGRKEGRKGISIALKIKHKYFTPQNPTPLGSAFEASLQLTADWQSPQMGELMVSR